MSPGVDWGEMVGVMHLPNYKIALTHCSLMICLFSMQGTVCMFSRS